VERRRHLVLLALALVVAAVVPLGAQALSAQAAAAAIGAREAALQARFAKIVTNAQREKAAEAAAALRAAAPSRRTATGLGLRSGSPKAAPALDPLGTPDYFGTIPNYANSPLPDLDISGNPVPGTGIRKFVDSLPGLGSAHANDLGNYLPVATPDTTTYPGSDYYVIALVRYTQKLHADLPPTTLQGYVQLDSTGETTLTPPSYLGPTIVAQSDTPVRIKFINELPTGSGGDLFLPVDTTVMGAGMGPDGSMYSQNRATLHLHGGASPWISDGTPHQWTTPAAENATYAMGVSVHNVPDMDGGNEPTGTLTFYYTNQQTARLMFYHDHSFGITRLNVYAGEAAPYVLRDDVETALVKGGDIVANGTTVTVAPSTVPTEEIPLVIQDKTFVPGDAQLAAEDPTWDKAHWGGLGNLWYPHVYMPNQIPSNDASGNELFGVNAMGRWDYAFWMYPPLEGIAHGPVPNTLFGNPGEPAVNPGVPNPSTVPEAFMDTPLVNGTPYPYLKVGRKAYRFRILNASNDRTLNLQLYFAKSDGTMWSAVATTTLLDGDAGEVATVAAVPHPGDPAWPSTWPTDGRDGGVPDPAMAGPQMIQIGTEGGFLPSATVLPNTPIGYEYFRRTILFGNVTSHTLLLGPAERADVIVDFSQVSDGTKLILYNDAPAPMPAFDSRDDYYTGDPGQVDIGGAPTTHAGYGPNTRTIMQFQVDESIAATGAFSLTALQRGLRAAYAASQDPPLVPEKAYGSVFATSYPNTYVHVTDGSITFTPAGQTAPVTFDFTNKALIEAFETVYGRQNAQLGSGLPNTGPGGGAALNFAYVDPPADIVTDTVPGTMLGELGDGTQIWQIEHQGVDTHAMHFHLFNVQVINRVAIDGQVLPPDPNELGWKETVRMNPGTVTYVALRPIAPTLPWKLPDSIRVLDPTLSENATFTAANGTVVKNVMTDFGWEYVWHCHLLDHEENDMMRPLIFRVAPQTPTTLTATPSLATTSPMQAVIRWHDDSGFPAATLFYLERATDPAFLSNVATFAISPAATSTVDTPLVRDTYYYRLRAENDRGYSTWSDTAVAVVPTLVAPNLGLPMLSPSRPTRNVRFTVTGTIGSADPVTRIVTLTFQRWAATHWVSAGTVNATLAAGSRRYSVRTRLTRTGIYRVRASHAQDTMHLAGISAWRSILVR
jgi:FtsP/CotA-like multicopper oxidase with cupredoxin domain